jgi:membrane fusion protein, heavy metal efflux system
MRTIALGLFVGLLGLIFTSCAVDKPAPVAAQAEAEGPEPLSVTRWTSKTELFAEYPPLEAGKTSRFAVHLTRLDNFQALKAGRVTIELAGESFRADGPSRPGIFGVDVKPAKTGVFPMTLRFSGEGIEDRHEFGNVTIAELGKSVSEEEKAGEELIPFLKEQQWVMDFATTEVSERVLRSSIRVPAEVVPRSGGEVEVSVPFSGRLVSTRFPRVGDVVRQGEDLASLLPPPSAPGELANLELARAEAEVALDFARKDRARAERLLASGAVPARRLEEAKTAEANAEARLNAAKSRFTFYEASRSSMGLPRPGTQFAIRSPISGVIAETHASSGANVKEGETLFKVVDLDAVYVSAIVPEAELPLMRKLSGAELEIPGLERARALTRLLTVGRIVDAARTFPVIYEWDNRGREVALNQTVYVRLFTSGSNASLVVPETALVDDGGRPVVFVQKEGEDFARRAVTTGNREGNLVEITVGLQAGDRVVSKGAALIRLSSMSKQVPVHGHVH